MENNLTIWHELHDTTKAWNDLKPWEYFKCNDWIKIDFENEETIYCTIMGYDNKCIGLSIYLGDKGYEDLCSIITKPIDDTVTTYMMYDQTCLTFYMGDREEVPPKQKKLIKDLGFKYRGRGNWPYFLSYKKRFSPYHINDNQAFTIIRVMKKLMEITNLYINNKIDVKFDENEIIHAYQKKDNWSYEPLCLPTPVDKFCAIEIADKSILEQASLAPNNHRRLIIDLVYMKFSITENDFDRPINPLMFIVLDEETQMIMATHFLSPDDDEIGLVLSFLIEYILKEGRPDCLFIRNPAVWAAIVDVCKECDIELITTPLQMIDYIISDMCHSFIDR